MVLIAIIIFPTACERINSSVSEPELLRFERFEVYGEIHNQFLTNIKENFKPDYNISDLNIALNYLDDFHQDFLQKANLKGLNRNYISKSLSNYKELSVYEKAYQRMFVRSNKSSTLNKGTTLFELLNTLKEDELLDEFEYQSLTELSSIVKESYDGNVSDDELKKFVLNLKKKWLKQDYTVDTKNGILMAYVLSISLSSLDWWENNTDAGVTTSSKGKVIALPAWAAMDIGGAIVSGAIAASGQGLLADEVSWDVVGYAALGGAVATSTGAAGKVAKWLGLM